MQCMLHRSFSVFLFCLLCPGLLVAMPVGSLYEASVPIADQSDAQRRQALPRAMGQVLVKLTGDPDIVDKQRAKPLINDAQSYVQQYRYIEPQPDSDEGLRLWTGFDEDAVNSALQRQGIATWGRERPATLIWLAVEDEDGRQIIGMEQAPAYLDPLTRRARERGLPLLLPLMDLEDTTRLNPADIASGSVDALREASARYPADVVLAVSLTGLDTGNVSARWTLLSEKAGNDSWNDAAESSAAVLNAGIDRLAETLAKRYAPTTFAGEATQLELTVKAVDDLDDYARAQRYLAGLSSVSQVDVLTVKPGQVVFRVESVGGGESLDQAITIGHTLRRDGDNAGDKRSYRLLP